MGNEALPIEELKSGLSGFSCSYGPHKRAFSIVRPNSNGLEVELIFEEPDPDRPGQVKEEKRAESLDGMSWPEAIERARDILEHNVHYLIEENTQQPYYI